MQRRDIRLLAILLLLISPFTVNAQDTTTSQTTTTTTQTVTQVTSATVRGTVKDNANSAISGAEVRLETSAGGTILHAITGADGQYQIVNVPPGSYKIHVIATGFKPAVATVVVSADAQQIIDLGIEAGAQAATLTVDTDDEVTQKEDNIVGSVLDSRRAQDLPLNSREPYHYLLLSPGAVHAPAHYSLRPFNYTTGSALQDARALPFTLGGLRDVPAVNGNRPSMGNYSLDGIDNNNQNVAGYNTNVSVDAVQEVRIATHNFTAEYGRNAGFITNIVTKTGSTEFHGSLFEFFNNDVLNADSFFAGFVQPDSQLFFEDNRDRIRRNQFGGTIGGPLGSNRILFFGSAEFHRERSALINTVNVPTREFINSLPLLTPQRVLLELFPTTTPTFGFNDSNGDGLAESGIGVASIYRAINRNMFTTRFDLLPSNSNRITLRFAYDDRNEDSLQGQLPGAGFGYQGFNTSIDSPAMNGAIQWIHTFNPRLYNDLTFGYNRFQMRARQPIQLDAPLVLVQPNTPVTETRKIDLVVPELEDIATGVALPSLRSDLPFRVTENTFQVRDIISYTRGDHHFKVGGEYRRYLAPSAIQHFSFGKFTFNGLAGGPGSYASGSQLYTQYLFDTTTGGAFPDTYRTFRRNEGFFFIQDDIKVTRNFTVNLGLRYEYFGVVSSKRPRGVGNVDANFYFGGGDGFFANVANGGFVPTDLAAGSLQDRLYGKDTNNFAPRIGLAYDLFGNARTVIRAGYGIFYDRVLNRAIENVRYNAPFATVGLFTGGPLTIFNTPIDPAEVLQSTFAPNAFAVDPRIRTPYVQQWSLGLQQDLGGNTVLEINYVGNTGRSLVVTSDVNRFAGSRFLGRPNPSVSRVFLTETAAKSFYHGLQVSVNRRFSNNLQTSFTYTYSHSIDEVSDPFMGINGDNYFASEAFTGPMEVRNFRLDRGSSDFDVRHRAMINVLYDLPFFSTQEGVIGKVLGGWQVNSIIALQSGQPFNVFATDDANGDLIFNDRAVFVGGGLNDATNNSPKEFGLRYLRPGLFLPSSLAGGTGASISRNYFTGPNFHNVDFSLIKNTKISEGVNVQLRAEFFNLFNKVNFLNPHGNLSNAGTFNLLTKTYNPRMVQLAFRLQF